MNNMNEVSSAEGNDIIITTRSKKVVSIVNPFHTHRVNGLSDEQCWSIIKTKTFDGNAQVPSVFEKIEKEIAKDVRICHWLRMWLGVCFVTANPNKIGAS